eukprot:TRINITY_DN4005_c0_g1_i3.p1 TRINITY_DN4005_c0_g1~~TRINITY_DN4005_c0_g1_i3.p1  ORF type:complete len:385 (+),score=63.92 TRINITY_DN4005_c0_g1_i3:125-1156(+)
MAAAPNAASDPAGPPSPSLEVARSTADYRTLAAAVAAGVYGDPDAGRPSQWCSKHLRRRLADCLVEVSPGLFECVPHAQCKQPRDAATAAARSNRGQPFHCQVCDILLNSWHQAQAHQTGARHLKRVRELKREHRRTGGEDWQPPPPVPLPVCVTIVTAPALLGKSHAAELRQHGAEGEWTDDEAEVHGASAAAAGPPTPRIAASPVQAVVPPARRVAPEGPMMMMMMPMMVVPGMRMACNAGQMVPMLPVQQPQLTQQVPQMLVARPQDQLPNVALPSLMLDLQLQQNHVPSMGMPVMVTQVPCTAPWPPTTVPAQPLPAAGCAGRGAYAAGGIGDSGITSL